MGTTTTGATTAATTGSEQLAEPITYSMMAQTDATRGKWSEMWVFGEIERIFKISFDITEISRDAWSEKKNIAFATNTLTDCLVNGSGGLTDIDLVTYGSSGTIIALNEYLVEYAPDIISVFDEYPEVRAAQTFPDGNIYTINGCTLNLRDMNKVRFWLNKKWAENLNVPAPTTLTEFYNYFKAIKDGDANNNGNSDDEIPLSGRYAKQDIATPILTALGFSEMRIETKNGKVMFVPVQPLYKEYLVFMNKLFTEGLLDQEYFTQNADQYSAKLSQGLVGAFIYDAHWTVMPDETLWRQYESIDPLISEFNKEKIWPAYDVRLINQWTITNQAEKPENLVRLLNWFYTKEGTLASNAGVENGKWPGGEGGYEWTTNDDGVVCHKLIYPDKYTSFNDFRMKVITPRVFPYLSIPSIPYVEWVTSLDARQVALTENLVRSEPYYVVRWSTNIKLTEEEANEANLFLTDIESYIAQMEAKIIVGELGINQFDTFVNGLYERGLERYLEIQQDAYNRWIEIIK
jgi:putative aldouronate transport system substrate-binding protein